jgi:hypothetical protein
MSSKMQTAMEIDKKSIIVMIMPGFFKLESSFYEGIIICNRSRFKGSGVQGSILVPGLHVGCVITRKASVSSVLIQNLKPKCQLLGKMNICNKDFGSSTPSLSLTLNVEP